MVDTNIDNKGLTILKMGIVFRKIQFPPHQEDMS